MKTNKTQKIENIIKLTQNEELDDLISYACTDEGDSDTESPQIEDKICISDTFDIKVDCKLIVIDSRKSLNNTTEYILAKIIRNNDAIPICLTGQDIQDSYNLIQKLSQTVVDECFHLNKQSYRLYRKQIFKNIPVKKVYACPGIQDNLFVASDSYYELNTQQYKEAPKYAVEKNYDCIENSLIDIEANCKPHLITSKTCNKSVIKEFFSNLVQTINNSEALLCFAGAIGTPLYNSQNGNRGIPPIFFLGESHSGKTTQLRCICSILGLNDSYIMSGSSTPYAITRALNSRIGIPVAIEEFDKKLLDNYDFIKNVYNKTPRERGTKNGVEKIDIFTNFVATSNYSFTNLPEEISSRILYANMKKAEFNSEQFQYFEEESRKNLPVILVELLGYYEQAIPIYNEVYDKVKSLIENPSGNRYLMNIAIACSVWEIINSICGSEIVYWQDLAKSYIQKYESQIENSVKNSDLMIAHIAKLISWKQIKYDVDYLLTKTKKLKLNPSKFVSAYNLVWGKDTNNMLTRHEFLEIMSTDKRFEDTRSNPSGSVGRCISIDVSDDEYLLDLIDNMRHYRD